MSVTDIGRSEIAMSHPWGWSRVILQNRSSETFEVYIHSPVMKFQEFYIQGSKKISYIRNLRRIQLKPGQTNLLIKTYIQHALSNGIQVWSKEHFEAQNHLPVTVFFTLFGASTLMLAFSIVLFFQNRTLGNFSYGMFLLNFILFSTFGWGIYDYFGGDLSLKAGLHVQYALFGLSISFHSLFNILIVGLNKDYPFLSWSLFGTIVLATVFLQLGLFLPLDYLDVHKGFAIPFYICVAILFVLTAKKALFRKFGAAQLVFTGQCFLIVGVSLGFFRSFFPELTIIPYLNPLGQIGEMLFFLLAVAHRNRQYLLSEIHAKEHSYRQLGKVFYPHQLNQIMSGKNLEETMPIGKQKACVISFDIVNSSKIEQEDVKDFFSSVIKQCERLMVEDYDDKELRAHAHCIKELGDGFVCSVGFPFKEIDSDGPCAGGVRLAFKFIKAFNKEVSNFGYGNIKCGIGIAYDDVEAYFPIAGKLSYDLYGRSIVLAKRFESFRKELFHSEEQESVIILPEQVYDKLPQELKVLFDNHELGDFKIRDSSETSHVYYACPDTFQSTNSSHKAG